MSYILHDSVVCVFRCALVAVSKDAVITAGTPGDSIYNGVRPQLWVQSTWAEAPTFGEPHEVVGSLHPVPAGQELYGA